MSLLEKRYLLSRIVGKKQTGRDENSITTLQVVISLDYYPFSITDNSGRTSKRSLYHEIEIGQDRLDK
ncbi:MAG: hypothetical protein A2Y53_00480 [Chloroflexi bacterium RBG_16_47_49]|nr:MAG: hypothetical protein A2Y53_00480 [Chloroflexi bacterium RBG_16_47_49]